MSAALCGRRSIFLLVVLLVANLLLASTFGAQAAHACSCASGVTPEETFQTSDAVFSGEVVDVSEDYFAPSTAPGLHLGPVTFHVEEAWKGVSEGETVVVHGHGDSASCGMYFGEGERYLVYAYRTGEAGDGPLATNVCMGTRLLAGAEAYPQGLGSTEPVLPETEEVPLEAEGA